MKILVDICHPAHFHFFRNPIRILKEAGHEVLITSRDKDVAVDLIETAGWEHKILCSSATSTAGLMRELVYRNIKLYGLVRKFKPDIMVAIGGIFIAHVGFLTSTPSLVFYDTENARFQNLMTYPFASMVAVPECYEGWTSRNTVRYPGFHELSYLGKRYFSPDIEVAERNGLSKEGDTFLVRVVAWQANHDVGESGWSEGLLGSVVQSLSKKGKVLISSEQVLPEKFRNYQYQGNVSEIHHVMAFCRLYVGESATMASESVMLGVPAVFVAESSRGYSNQQERLGLLWRTGELEPTRVEQLIVQALSVAQESYRERWQNMMDSMVDMPAYIVNLIHEIREGGVGSSQ